MQPVTYHYLACFLEFTCNKNAIPNVPHATHNASALPQHPSGTIVRYTCSDGYRKAVAGDIKCVGTTWKGSQPSCTAQPTSVSPSLDGGPTIPGAQKSFGIGEITLPFLKPSPAAAAHIW